MKLSDVLRGGDKEVGREWGEDQKRPLLRTQRFKRLVDKLSITRWSCQTYNLPFLFLLSKANTSSLVD